MRVGFYIHHSFHRTLFASTLAALDPRHEQLISDDLETLIRLRPHVFVAAENLYHHRLRRRLPRTTFIHTRHGLASKNVPVESFSAADFVCVTSPHIRDDFIKRGIKPRKAYWPLGYVQMDNLVTAPRPSQIPSGKRVVLYAPTWNTGISSLPLLGDRVVDLLKGGRSDTFVVIKTHPLVQEDHTPDDAPWLHTLRSACAGRDDVHLVENRSADIMAWLNAADVLVSDASSVILEYLALDRPMVLINNPGRFQSRFFDPTGYEWQWRDMGHELDDVEALPTAINHALTHPSANRDKRQRRRDHLFGATADGGCGQRLARKIESLKPASELVLLLAELCARAFQHALPLYRRAFHVLTTTTASLQL
jgi:hypothetical protein